MIHLQCAEEVALERIRGRGRKEEEGITRDYLRSLCAAIDERVEEHSKSSTLITMRSDDSDFRQDGAARATVSRTLLSRMGLPARLNPGVPP
jgi:deoxyadenosine/deoxycytidine kinase